MNVTRKIIPRSIFAIPVAKHGFPVVAAHYLLEVFSHHLEVGVQGRVFDAKFTHDDGTSFLAVHLFSKVEMLSNDSSLFCNGRRWRDNPCRS